VTQARRRAGLGASLVEDAIAAGAAGGAGWVVVLGDPSYYVRFGFAPASGFGLIDEYGGGDAFQVLELTPGCLPREAGLVRFAPEFAVVA
jgi:putative acetyltransferase